MIRNEIYSAGLAGGLNEAQLLFQEQYEKLSAVRAGDVRRNLLAMAVTRKPKDGQRDRKGKKVRREPITKDRLILDFSEIDIWLMWDRPVRGRQAGHRVETIVSGETPFVDRTGAVRIGGDPHRNHSFYCFDEPPFSPFQVQSETVLGKEEQLTAPRSGDLYVRRLGDEFVDLCLEHRGHRYVAYRLPAEAVDAGHVELRFAGPLPEAGQSVHAVNAPVEAGEVLAEIGDYEVCYTRGIWPPEGEGWPQIAYKAPRLLCANKWFEFMLFNIMNFEMTELTRFDHGEPLKHPVDPNRWQLGYYFEFPSLQGIVQHSKFSPTQALQRDLCDALGPRGLNKVSSARTPGAGQKEFFRLRAEHHGRIVGAELLDNGYLRLDYDGGQVQYVPSAAELTVTEHDQLAVGDVLGDWCNRDVYGWHQLENMFGNTLPFVLEQFLTEWSIKPGEHGWDGKNVLVDSRYARDIVTELGARDHRDRLICKLDLRSAADYVDPEMGVILPPMRYANWKDPHVDLWGASLFLGTAEERDKRYREDRRRQRKRTFRNKKTAKS